MEPNARLNVTFSGSNGDYPDPVDFDANDGDLKQVATEAIRTGYIPGIPADANVDLTDFVVDRFPATDGLPARCLIRPKTPFGGEDYDVLTGQMVAIVKEENEKNLKEAIYSFLRGRGCKLTEELGIVMIMTPEGVLWDMTIPREYVKVL